MLDLKALRLKAPRCPTFIASSSLALLAAMTEALPVPLPAEDEKTKIAASTSSASPSTVPNDIYIDPAIEKRVIRKCDLRVVPPTLILFMLSFLDRVNIGNAAIQGLPEDLALIGHQFNVALLILFIPFILLEIPSNLVMKRLDPSTWLSVLLFGCGMAYEGSRASLNTNTQSRHHEHVYGLCQLVWCPCRRTLSSRYLRSWVGTWINLPYLHVLPTLRIAMETFLVVLLRNHRWLFRWIVGLRDRPYGWYSRIQRLEVDVSITKTAAKCARADDVAASFSKVFSRLS